MAKLIILPGNIDAASRMPQKALKIQLRITAEDPNDNGIKLNLKESDEDLALNYC